MEESKYDKRKKALGLFVESVLEPDSRLRCCAHNQECYHELMEWREEVLQFLQNRRKQEFSD